MSIKEEVLKELDIKKKDLSNGFGKPTFGSGTLNKAIDLTQQKMIEKEHNRFISILNAIISKLEIIV